MASFGEREGLLVKRECNAPDCDNTLVTDVEIGYIVADASEQEKTYVAETYCAVCQELDSSAALVVSRVTKDDEFVPV